MTLPKLSLLPHDESLAPLTWLSDLFFNEKHDTFGLVIYALVVLRARGETEDADLRRAAIRIIASQSGSERRLNELSLPARTIRGLGNWARWQLLESVSEVRLFIRGHAGWESARAYAEYLVSEAKSLGLHTLQPDRGEIVLSRLRRALIDHYASDLQIARLARRASALPQQERAIVYDSQDDTTP